MSRFVNRNAAAAAVVLAVVCLAPGNASAGGSVTLQKIYNWTNQGTATVGEFAADYAGVRLCKAGSCVAAYRNVTHVYNRSDRPICLYAGASYTAYTGVTVTAGGAKQITPGLAVRSHRPC